MQFKYDTCVSGDDLEQIKLGQFLTWSPDILEDVEYFKVKLDIEMENDGFIRVDSVVLPEWLQYQPLGWAPLDSINKQIVKAIEEIVGEKAEKDLNDDTGEVRECALLHLVNEYPLEIPLVKRLMEYRYT